VNRYVRCRRDPDRALCATLVRHFEGLDKTTSATGVAPTQTLMNSATNQAATHIGVLLAAGAGSRFGGAYPGAKLDALIDGVPVGVRSFERLHAACDATVVVVRDAQGALARHARASGAQVIVNTAPNRGMGHSFAIATDVIQTLYIKAQYIWAVMADSPFIENKTFQVLSQQLLGDRPKSSYSILQPIFAPSQSDIASLSERAKAQLGLPGHPVVFGRAHWQAIAALDGDQGAKQIIAANREHVIQVPIADEGIWRDIDAPGDLL
jgi:molybdenum cofactor cytidylyltransferase